MKMLFSIAIIMLFGWGQVFCEFEDNIIFNSLDQPATAPAPTQSRPAKVDLGIKKHFLGLVRSFSNLNIVAPNNCPCMPAAKCPTSGPAIDIRIVNNGESACPPNYVQCCNSTPSPPTADPTCGIRKIQPTVQPMAIGQASFGAYPWQVALLTAGQQFIGSGVLIGPSHVLTTAHKVISYVNKPSSLFLRMGEWNAVSTNEPYQFLQLAAAKITTHPSFNPGTLENDVAVVRIQGVVPISSYPNINTACPPTAAPVAGTRCYVSGWGKNQFGPYGTYQSIMREVDVPIIGGTDCENRLRQTRLGPSYMLNKTSFLCAGGEIGKDACTGDGGAPLVCQTATGQWAVYGLVAWGIGCANPGVPGVYTNVYNFWSWISNAKATTYERLNFFIR